MFRSRRIANKLYIHKKGTFYHLKFYSGNLVIWKILVTERKYKNYKYGIITTIWKKNVPRKKNTEIHNKSCNVIFLRHKNRGAFIQKWIIVWYVSSSLFHFAAPFSNEHSVSSMSYKIVCTSITRFRSMDMFMINERENT